ncbi:hypothetical protein CW304_32595 [Bacillus sp. UFRGS-B20]|nr:hypothetical protein CW304_32595 [Bacillus sp. UFRGS-B20]
MISYFKEWILLYLLYTLVSRPIDKYGCFTILIPPPSTKYSYNCYLTLESLLRWLHFCFSTTNHLSQAFSFISYKKHNANTTASQIVNLNTS